MPQCSAELGHQFVQSLKYIKSRQKIRKGVSPPSNQHAMHSGTCWLPTWPEIQTPPHGNCSQGAHRTTAYTTGCHSPLPGLCGEQAQKGRYHRSPAFSATTDILFAKQCLRDRLWCLRLCADAQEYRPALTCLHCSSQQGQTPAEEMGETRSRKR